MINTIIVIITSIYSIIAFNNKKLIDKGVFNPYLIKKNKQYYRFITHGFLHANFLHLLFNMFVLYIFGKSVEHFFIAFTQSTIKGEILYVLLYFGGLIGASLPGYKKHENDIYYNSLGASGAVSGVMVAYIIFQPVQNICLYGLLCFPGIIWLVGYIGYSYYMGKRGTGNIDHDAHFFGALFGLLFTFLFIPNSFHIFIGQIMKFFQ